MRFGKKRLRNYYGVRLRSRFLDMNKGENSTVLERVLLGQAAPPIAAFSPRLVHLLLRREPSCRIVRSRMVVSASAAMGWWAVKPLSERTPSEEAPRNGEARPSPESVDVEMTEIRNSADNIGIQ